MDLLQTINRHLNGNRCPGQGALGECAAISTIRGHSGHTFYVASIYLHRAAEDLKPAEVARWFTDAGAAQVEVAHVLDDADNEVHDGRAPDGVRPWDVTFTLPAAHPAAAAPWPIKGVRVDGDKVIVAVKGGNDAARWLCGELLAVD